jgi:type IV secretory pathway VirB2 component (pilin)
MNKKYLIATCISLLLVSPCLTLAAPLQLWDTSIDKVIETVQGKLLGVLGAVCVIMIIIGGALYMTAKDDAGQAKAGKTTVEVALIGLVIVLASAMLMTFVSELGGSK